MCLRARLPSVFLSPERARTAFSPPLIYSGDCWTRTDTRQMDAGDGDLEMV